MGIGPGWDCGRCRLDGLNGLLLHCRDSILEILGGIDRVDAERLFPLVGESKVRGHNFRVRGHPVKTEMRMNFFSEGCESVKFFAAEGYRDWPIKYVKG